KDEYKTLKDKLGIDLEAMGNKEALQALVDRHGTGRVYFRNTRQKMASYSEFFPKRVLHTYKLNLGKSKNTESNILNVKAEWLAGFAEQHKNEKTLLICHDKEVVLALEKKL